MQRSATAIPSGADRAAGNSTVAACTTPPPPPVSGESPGPEPLRSRSTLPQYSPRTRTSGPYNARGLVAVRKRHQPVDFSYMDLVDFRECALVRNDLEPRSGKVYIAKEQMKSAQQMTTRKQEEEEEERRRRALLFGDFFEGKTELTKDGFKVLHAKQETYAFKEGVGSNIANDADVQRYTIDANGNLVERKRTVAEEAKHSATRSKRYICSSLRLNNNKFCGATLKDFPLFVFSVLHAPAKYLTQVDLSCNRIAEIPDAFEGLPIHTLLLHENSISRVTEVAKLKSLEPSLRRLTLYANPIQTAIKKYRLAVLHLLPFLKTLDDSTVTPKDRELLATFNELFYPVRLPDIKCKN